MSDPEAFTSRAESEGFDRQELQTEEENAFYDLHSKNKIEVIRALRILSKNPAAFFHVVRKLDDEDGLIQREALKAVVSIAFLDLNETTFDVLDKLIEEKSESNSPLARLLAILVYRLRLLKKQSDLMAANDPYYLEGNEDEFEEVVQILIDVVRDILEKKGR